MTKSYDVVVVGGGPAGSATASVLASRGYGVLLLDRASFPRDKACAEYCSPGVVDALVRLGAWEAVGRLAHRLHGIGIHVDGTEILPVQYSNGKHERLAFTACRPEFDNVLLHHALDKGVEVLQQHRVTKVAIEGEEARLWTSTPAVELNEWTGRVVVGADGIHSTVARSLHIPTRTGWPRRIGLITHYEGVAMQEDVAEMHVTDNAYCGLAPLSGGRTNVGLVTSLSGGPGRKLSLQARFNEAIARMPEVEAKLRSGRRVTSIRGMALMRRHVESTGGDGFLLVGDAAGFLDPFTGEGIYRALRGAEIAATLIDHKFQTAVSRPLNLNGYGAIRRREFAHKEMVTWIIQLGLSQPGLLRGICGRIRANANLFKTAGNVLGDCEDARKLTAIRSIAEALLPSF